MFLLVSIFYIFFAILFVAPPTEFISAGLTIQNILSGVLGSEEMNFVEFHIRRTTVTMIVHSLLFPGYYICMGLFAPELDLFNLMSPHLSMWWTSYYIFCIVLVIVVLAVAKYWHTNRWENHPIAEQLAYLGQGRTWRTVAASINTEFRRIDKFTSGTFGRRIIVTDSWVMKTSTYYVYIAHQSDIQLSLDASEEHPLSYETMSAAQFLNISIKSANSNVKPFLIRLNAMELGDLKEKLQTPIRNARHIVIRQSLSDQFLEAFRQQIERNPPFHKPPTMEVETCIGCLQKTADVKLHKLCDEADSGECRQCFCRPMWCLECMGKWFASRQDQGRPDTWMSSQSPCPTCRSPFCVLDVCRLIH